ncbi:HET-domain-containing protein, partial [Cubamyces sp. BRFM 1775]
PDDPASRWIKGRILIPHVGAPYAMSMAKTCIEECVRTHTKCQAITTYPIGSAPLPTRLIDCSNPDRLRIVETKPGMRGLYVALSYVWGEPQPHRTTKANLTYYKVRIDSAILPQTIRDAVWVTRALGIGWLWIDSICIIQDSEKDIHQELGRMRDVYRHAFLTIDAGSAARVSDGFLQIRRLNPEPSACLPFVCPSHDHRVYPSAGNAQVGMIYWVPSDDPLKLVPEDDDWDYGTTSDRAWCLQERLLSTLSLVFTSQTLQLRCHTHTQNVGGAYHDGLNDVPRLPEAILLPNRSILRSSDEWEEICYRWRNIVGDYTQRSLSNPSDKLVALSALAELFAPTLGPDYLAGLWRDTLLYDLLWMPRLTSAARPIRRYAHAPSWSWASYDGGVEFPNRLGSGRVSAKVIKCTVNLQNKNLPFGEVAGGSLVLAARLIPCKWDGSDSIDSKRALDRGQESAYRSVKIGPWAPRLSSSTEDDHLVFAFRTDCDDDEALHEMWFIPLLEMTGEGVAGLVITRAGRDESDRRREVYRRVGFWDFWAPHAMDVIRQWQYPKEAIELV